MSQFRLRLEKPPRRAGMTYPPARLEETKYPRVIVRSGVTEVHADCVIEGCGGQAVAEMKLQAPYGSPAIGHGLCAKCGASYAMELS